MSPSTPAPGHARQTQYRTLFRALALLLPVGVVLVGVGFVRFASAEPSFEPGMPPGFGMFVAGGLLAVVGMLCAGLGFQGAAARFGAGETMPVVKDSAAFLSDGEGVLGVGRTVDDAAPTATGPFCRSCGTRNDEDAKFCDSCGQPLA